MCGASVFPLPVPYVTGTDGLSARRRRMATNLHQSGVSLVVMPIAAAMAVVMCRDMEVTGMTQSTRRETNVVQRRRRGQGGWRDAERQGDGEPPHPDGRRTDGRTAGGLGDNQQPRPPPLGARQGPTSSQRSTGRRS
ncbi:hypothetical protein KIN20_035153 [Parelaphostrongylus tenuis]|uniref:Uncharacterized protein n=1 Tax=Parelaphostrongylus tenuis TaxID=148309 RepID=A0AAD5RBD2_PARTN|nr:hypothetical protein KIN20_035153 [Parelaphostrongylus tenuis]